MDVDDNPLPSTLEEARKSDRQKNNEKSEEAIKPDDAKTVRDLSREAKNKAREQERQADPSNDNDGGTGEQ